MIAAGVDGLFTFPTIPAGSYTLVVQMAGFKALKASRPDDPVLVFKPDGTWTGSDGCNDLQGTYSIGQRGAFSATSGPQHMIGCENEALAEPELGDSPEHLRRVHHQWPGS